MSKDTRNILIAIAIAWLALFVQGIVAHRDLVEEIRVGDGHVNSFVGTQHDHMMQKDR